jgi:hypothetical protein
MKIAIIGSRDWQSKRKLQDVLSRLKQLEEPITILGQGGNEGAPSMVKKYALEFGMNYSEFNPSYSGRNLYSAMPDAYYGKKYHFSQLLHRMTLIANACDKMIILSSGKLDPQLDTAYKRATKLQKSVVILK